jgi:hypothetical protein
MGVADRHRHGGRGSGRLVGDSSLANRWEVRCEREGAMAKMRWRHPVLKGGLR